MTVAVGDTLVAAWGNRIRGNLRLLKGLDGDVAVGNGLSLAGVVTATAFTGGGASLSALSGSALSAAFSRSQHPVAPEARLWCSSDLSLSASTWTVIPFDTVVFDTDGIAGSSMLTCRTAGKYAIWASVQFHAGFQHGYVRLHKNRSGSAKVIGLAEGYYTAAFNTYVLTVAALAVGDTIEAEAWKAAAHIVQSADQYSPLLGMAWLSP